MAAAAKDRASPLCLKLRIAAHRAPYDVTGDKAPTRRAAGGRCGSRCLPGTSGSTARLDATDSTEEAAILIAVDDVQKGLEAMNLGVRLVAMPFEVAPHPEHPPSVLRPNEGRLCDRMLHRQLRVPPIRPDLEDLHALPCKPISDVELRPDIGWRTTLCHELGKVAFASLAFEICQRHDSSRQMAPDVSS